MKSKSEPNWQPIRNLPLIAKLIDGQLTEAKRQYTTLLEARPKPYVLDDYMVQRVIRAYTEQLEFLWVYEKQLTKWKKEERLTSSQQSEISRLQKQLEHSRKILTDILTLAEEFKKGTIEKVMAKSDLKLGIEFLRSIKKPD
ncbi:hypothetical protein [Ammoniphilus sp. YIM 78166]|uniref:hypothetical protein n=1 Tax=Ammoniphilus sp. YIM 78166 TaxID=1644106 RepID=UPI00106FAE49|nr:hypothetical protein [Ammoniphilus sp. YIM 78166]